MKIKVNKYAYINTADILINRIDCTPENLAKLIDVFEFKKNIEIKADVSFAEKKELSFEKIEEFKLKHKAFFQKDKHSNGLFWLIALSNECENFLIDVFNFDVEFIAIYSGKDESLLEQNLSYDMCKRLIKQKRLDVFITVAIDEYAIAITISKDYYDAKHIASKIKKLFE